MRTSDLIGKYAKRTCSTIRVSGREDTSYMKEPIFIISETKFMTLANKKYIDIHSSADPVIHEFNANIPNEKIFLDDCWVECDENGEIK